MYLREITKTDLRRTDDEKRNCLGRLGEQIVGNYYSQRNHSVVYPLDLFDSAKDVLVDKFKLEVKTMVPLISQDAFTFRVSQLQKCKNSDAVYFVSVPAIGKHHFSFGKVYAIKSDLMRYSFYHKNFGERGSPRMVKVPILQEGMKEIFTCSEEECVRLIEYSTSSYNKVNLDG